LLPRSGPLNSVQRNKLNSVLSSKKEKRTSPLAFMQRNKEQNQDHVTGEWKFVPGLPPLHMDLTPEEEKRRRYRVKVQERFERLGPRWSIGFSLLSSVVPRDVNGDYELFLYKCLDKVESSEELFHLLKGITEAAKVGGDQWSPYWSWHVNLETLGGYLHEVPLSIFEETVRDWATGEIKHASFNEKGEMSEELFIEDLKQGMKNFLSEAPGVAEATKRFDGDLKHWLGRVSNWGGAGTTTEKEKMVGVYREDEKVKAKNTKWVTALLSQTSDLYSRVVDTRLNYGINKVIEKRETAKVRGVVNSDDITYLRMSWLSSWIDVAMKGHSDTALYMSNKQKLDLWADMLKLSQTGTGWKVPLDQSHFDWQQSVKMLSVAVDVIEEWMTTYVDNEEVRLVFKLIKESLTNGKSYVTLEDQKMKIKIMIEKGIMSGWRWTSFLDTLFNAGEFYAVMKALERVGLRPFVIRKNFQGDDVRLVVGTANDCYNVLITYEKLGFEVNPSKTWVDRWRDEFLRRVAGSKVIAGYPCRAISSLLWRNPIKNEPYRGVDRVAEQVSGWVTLVQRGCDKKKVLDNMQKDVFHGNKGVFSNMRELKNVLGTYANIGGMGLPLEVSDYLKLNPSRTELLVRPELVTFPGLIATSDELERKGKEGLDSNEESNYAKARVYFYNAPPIVTVARTETVNYNRVLMQSRKLTTGQLTFPTTAPFLPSEELGLDALTVLKERYLREKEYAAVDDLLKNGRQDGGAVELVEKSKKIRMRGGKAFWIDWVTGGVDVKVGFRFNISREVVSMNTNLMAGQLLLSLVNHSQEWNYQTWRHMLAKIEGGTPQAFVTYDGVRD